MAELIESDRVTKLATDYLEGEISSREFRRALRDLTTAELNELAEFTRRRQACQPEGERDSGEPLGAPSRVCP